MIFAGFDCGGSKTRCVLVTEEGRIVGRGEGGPANYLFCGKEVARESLTKSYQEALASGGAAGEHSAPEGVFIASSATEVFEGASHEAFFKEVLSCEKLQVDSDIFPVWFAGSRFRPAIAQICGTGAVTYLLRDHTYIKASGWGPWFGDEGSGYDLGRLALQKTVRMGDGRDEMDRPFFEAVLAHYGVSKEDQDRLLRAVNQGDYRSRIASAGAVVDKLYQEGNATANELFEYGAREVESCVKAVLSRSGDEKAYSFIVSGGLFRENSPLFEKVKERLSRLSRIERIYLPSQEAVISAAAIALFQSGRVEAAEKLMEMNA